MHRRRSSRIDGGGLLLLSLIGAQPRLEALLVEELLHALRAAFLRIDELQLVRFGTEIVGRLFPAHVADHLVCRLLLEKKTPTAFKSEPHQPAWAARYPCPVPGFD